jgi:hypothetical protein
MDTKFAPYAPPQAVIGIIHHYKERDVPERISTTNLLQIGVTESLLQRVTAAIRFLGLINEDGTTTDLFRALRYASEDDYHEVLAGVLNAAYKDVLDHIDLGTATERELYNAFIPFSPGGQRGRMITLFVALCREAGWDVAAQSRTAAPTSNRRAAAKPQPKATSGKATDQRRVTTIPNRGGDETPVTSGLLFGVTESDIAALPDSDFDAVWAALGKVARARAKASADREAEARLAPPPSSEDRKGDE